MLRNTFSLPLPLPLLYHQISILLSFCHPFISLIPPRPNLLISSHHITTPSTPTPLRLLPPSLPTKHLPSFPSFPLLTHHHHAPYPPTKANTSTHISRNAPNRQHQFRHRPHLERRCIVLQSHRRARPRHFCHYHAGIDGECGCGHDD